MTERVIRNPTDLQMWVTYLSERKLPITVSCVAGKVRSTEQNRLQRMWCNEIAEQLGDQTPEEVRGYCKLTMAVPILRAEDEVFATAYDKAIKELPYETKLICMMEPIDFPVTRRMNVDQKTRFLDHMYRFWTDKGLMLTEPERKAA